MAPVVKRLQLSHISDAPIYVALIRDVKNAPELLNRVQAAGKDEQNVEERADLEYAFLDASAIYSTTHLLAAVFRALNDHQHNRLKSKKIHSEIVFCLSPNNNIGESFRRFGVAQSTKDLLIVKVLEQGSNLTQDSISHHLATKVRIDGTPVPYSDEALSHCTDMEKIEKIYKVNEDGNTKKVKRNRNPETQINGDPISAAEGHNMDLDSVILGTMALRGS